MSFLDAISSKYYIYIFFISILFISTVKSDSFNNKIVVIDSDVPEYQNFMNNVSPGYKVHILKSKNRLNDLNTIITKYNNIKELHLISHGSSGTIKLGSVNIDKYFLNENNKVFKSWKNKFSNNSIINLYGCKIAAGEYGQAFIEQLSKLTKNDICASDDITGSALKNGNWDLEFNSGIVNKNHPFNEEFVQIYSHILDSLYVTNTLDDTTAGSLRQAISNASSGDIIIFTGINYPDTIRLISGEISISNLNLVILGPGADSLSISGEDTSRIFSFGEGGAEVHGLSLINGYANFGNGGAFNLGSTDFLHLYDCIISGNEAIGDSTQPSLSGLGGAIYNNGDLRIYRSSIFNNNSTGGQSSEGLGGAIYQTNDTCIINNCSFSNNTVRGRSGFAGNGGGIYVVSGIVDISNSTFTNNNALNGSAGGVYHWGGNISLSNTIIAGNLSGSDPDVSGTFISLGFNLIGNTSGSSGWTGNDVIGVDPLLGILRNNGGPTPTHALLPNSPAIDVGDSTIADSIDQRGFPRIQDGNGDDIAVIDIGAYEAVVPDKPTNLVATHGDSLVNLTWQYNNSASIVQYNIYRDSISTPISNVPSPTTSFTDINLVNGQLYTYYVTAVDTIGFESSLSLPDSATPNGPPVWSIPQGLFTFDEDDSLLVDLDNYLFDDSDPNSTLTINYSNETFVTIFIDPVTHIANFSAPENIFGLDTIIFIAADPEGLTAADTVIVRVNPVNDYPVITNIPDSTILTYTDFNYQVVVNDLEGDSLAFFDNTNLFNIDSTGLISFRPTITDTGVHEITIFVTDNDTTIRDTFGLNIQLSVVNYPLNLTVTPLDQALSFSWLNPVNAFYSGTRIIRRKDMPVTHPDSGFLALDTVFALTGNVTATISNLDIAENYYFLIFNYFRENSDVIFSNFIPGSDSTLSPQVSVDFSPRSFSVLNETIYDTSIVLSNSGGGTLIGKFRYNPTSVQATWFTMDSTVQFVAPFSSINVPVRFNIPPQLLDTLLTISISLTTNQPGWLEQSIDINVNNVFDRYAPQVVIESEPDSVVKQAAVRFEFTANDTADSQIGDLPEQLFIRYTLYNNTTNQFVEIADSLHTNEIIIYPLTDGSYELSLWIYDRSGNGNKINEVTYIKRFIVQASQRTLPDRKWLLSSIPRDQNYTFMSSYTDSDFVLFRWNPREEEYNRITNNSVKPGLGYWIYSGRKVNINVNTIPFQTVDDSVVVPIMKGWNQIGVPMPFEVDLNKVRLVQENASISAAITLNQAVLDSLIAPGIYWYKALANQVGYDWGTFDTTFTEPWRGYWIFSNINGNLIYAKEPSFRNSDAGNTNILKNLTDQWELNLSVSCENMIDSKNIIGNRIGRKLEIPEPPVLDQFVSMYFKSGKNKLTGVYNLPLKDYTEVKQFDMYIETSEINKEHLIKWQLPENNVYFYLVDNYSEHIIDLRENSEYVISPSLKTSGMTLYVTYDADFRPSIIPVEFKLKQNYPNPFNPVTTIEFGIPENGKDNITTLKIFNILGQEITTLINGKVNSGYHKITWNGLNKNNQKVASGLYFYSLSNGKTELFKKMIFIK